MQNSLLVITMAVSLVSDDELLYLCACKGLLILSIAVAVLCDWTLASLPIVFLWNLQMSTKLKAGICILMSMGFL